MPTLAAEAPITKAASKAAKAPAWVRQLDEAVEAIAQQRDALVRAYEALRSERDALRKTEHYEHASIYYREDRFAYLHVRRPEGGRDRIYIGVDAEKIASIEEAIERGKRLTVVSAALDAFERDASRWTSDMLLNVYGMPRGLCTASPEIARLTARPLARAYRSMQG